MREICVFFLHIFRTEPYQLHGSQWKRKGMPYRSKRRTHNAKHKLFPCLSQHSIATPYNWQRMSGYNLLLFVCWFFNAIFRSACIFMSLRYYMTVWNFSQTLERTTTTTREMKRKTDCFISLQYFSCRFFSLSRLISISREICQVCNIGLSSHRARSANLCVCACVFVSLFCASCAVVWSSV